MAVEDGLSTARLRPRLRPRPPPHPLAHPYHAVGAGRAPAARRRHSASQSSSSGRSEQGPARSGTAAPAPRGGSPVTRGDCGGHRHALARGGGARRHGMGLALHVHHAHAARPDGAHVLQVAQRGNTDRPPPAPPPGRSCPRERATRDAVYRQARHAAPCLPPSRRSRTGRSAGSVRTPVWPPRGSCRTPPPAKSPLALARRAARPSSTRPLGVRSFGRAGGASPTPRPACGSIPGTHRWRARPPCPAAMARMTVGGAGLTVAAHEHVGLPCGRQAVVGHRKRPPRPASMPNASNGADHDVLSHGDQPDVGRDAPLGLARRRRARAGRRARRRSSAAA